MNNTLLIGDYLIVNKIFYGPLSKILDKTGHWNKPVRNDVLVFTNANNSITYVKRCLGLPGEKIEVINSNAYIDGQYVLPPETSCRYVKVWYQDYNDLKKCVNFENIVQKFSNYAVVNLDKNEEISLLSNNGIDSLEIFTENNGSNNSVFNYSSFSGNEISNLFIPFKGLKIRLDSINIKLYRNIIEEEVSIEKKGNFYYIDKRPVKYYTFKNDYYFMMGDNRNSSMDSRLFGPIARRNIVGKVFFKINPLLNDFRIE